MLPCFNQCAYKKAIPGSAHISCTFTWKPSEMHGAPTPNVAKWFRFPLNFDPTWGPKECASYSTVLDPEKQAKPNPLAEILSLLGGR